VETVNARQMILTLPKDVLWLILKRYILDIFDAIEVGKLKNFHFDIMPKYQVPAWRDDTMEKNFFEKTIEEMPSVLNGPYEDFLHKMYVVDYLYSLRLVCKRFDTILCDKITKVTSPSKERFHQYIALPFE
jgi:hypothetical protein